MTGPTVVLGLPIDCTGIFAGCERAPAALRAAGLVTHLGLPDLGDLPIRIDDPTRDPATGMIGYRQVVAVSHVIRDAVHDLLAGGQRPLLIGGCCTLMIGTAAALNGLYGDDVGLVFVDGHADCYDGISSPTGEAADMDLAIVTGSGPAELTALSGHAPMIRPRHTALIGTRDLDAARRDGSPNPPPGAIVIPAEAINGLAEASTAGRTALGALLDRVARFWLHLDLDVLSSEALPAVDYPIPGGLDWDELAAIVGPMIASPSCVGIDVTIYNPTLDHDGRSAQRIVGFLESVTGRHSESS
ncbi:MAG: arginase family protein [Chloroflexi bacterium]|nr:arginase family protein [Chloroflexota bacterium]